MRKSLSVDRRQKLLLHFYKVRNRHIKNGQYELQYLLFEDYEMFVVVFLCPTMLSLMQSHCWLSRRHCTSYVVSPNGNFRVRRVILQRLSFLWFLSANTDFLSCVFSRRYFHLLALSYLVFPFPFSISIFHFPSFWNRLLKDAAERR